MVMRIRSSKPFFAGYRSAPYQPGIFEAVMDYMEFTENLAADTDPTNPDPR
jgi:hypothetical protein